MPADIEWDITAGQVQLRRVVANIDGSYSSERLDRPGRGVTVELAAVLELFAAIQDGRATAQQAADAFTPAITAARALDEERRAWDEGY